MSGFWILAAHFTCAQNQSLFESLTLCYRGSVLLGNNKSCKGIGTVRLKLHDGLEKVMQQVRYILELKWNLISLGMLETHGY